MSHVQDIWMCGFKPTDSFFFSPLSFFLVYDVWLCGFKPAKSLFFPPFSSFILLKLVHVNCVRFIPRFYCLQTPSCIVIQLFSWGKPLHSYLKFLLVALNSDSQPIAGIPIWSVATASSLEFSLGTRPDKASSPFPALTFTSLHDCKFFVQPKQLNVHAKSNMSRQIDQSICT